MQFTVPRAIGGSAPPLKDGLVATKAKQTPSQALAAPVIAKFPKHKHPTSPANFRQIQAQKSTANVLNSDASLPKQERKPAKKQERKPQPKAPSLQLVHVPKPLPAAQPPIPAEAEAAPPRNRAFRLPACSTKELPDLSSLGIDTSLPAATTVLCEIFSSTRDVQTKRSARIYLINIRYLYTFSAGGMPKAAVTACSLASLSDLLVGAEGKPLQATEDALHQSVVPSYFEEISSTDKKAKNFLWALNLHTPTLRLRAISLVAAPQPMQTEMQQLPRAMVLPKEKKPSSATDTAAFSPLLVKNMSDHSSYPAAAATDTSSMALLSTSAGAISSAAWLPTPGALEKEERAAVRLRLTESGQIPLSLLKSLLL